MFLYIWHPINTEIMDISTSSAYNRNSLQWYLHYPVKIRQSFALNALTQNVFAAPYINKAFLEDSEFILEVAQHQPSIVTYVNQGVIDTNKQLKAIQGQNIDDDLPF